MKNNTLWLVQTALMIALLVVSQAVTKAGGQFVTGSCVNAVLAVTVLTCGMASGLTVALISPFMAFVLGIGPQLIYIVPAIAVGNAVFVVLLHLLYKEKIISRVIALLVSATAKFTALYLLVSVLLCNVLPLKPPQIATFQAMFSWPQLVTALIGGAAAMVIVPAIKKGIRK
ncbi:MAG: ECF transporter S component [Ruminococcaceae bacterium]|nr:ECF transporter S component [Oscillospiraceae bacterium]